MFDNLETLYTKTISFFKKFFDVFDKDKKGIYEDDKILYFHVNVLN